MELPTAFGLGFEHTIPEWPFGPGTRTYGHNGSGGSLGLVETLRQLTGHADGRQVRDATIGLVSGFGMINFDRGLGSGAAILAAC